MTDLSDMDDFDTVATRPASSNPHAVVSEMTCTRCQGRKVVTYGFVNITTYPCTLCRGTGKITGKRIQRVASAKKARVSSEQNRLKRIEAFKQEHPGVYTWLVESPNFAFAASLYDSLTTYGRLSDNQLAAAERCVVKLNETKANEAAAREEAKVDLGEGPRGMFDAFGKAKLLGTKRPTFRTQEMTFSCAPDSGRNAGQLYVKSKIGVYLGKIDCTGRFAPTRECTPELVERVKIVAADPLTAAVEYGKLTGICACCGKELSDEKSVELGIGPICLKKYF